MPVKIDKNILVEGGIHQVDDTPRYALGTKVIADDGRVFQYVKATAALTAGTAVGEAGFTAVTMTAIDGGASVTASTPATAISGDLVGQMVKVTRSGNVIGVYPITEDDATGDGNKHTVRIPEVKAGDTLALCAYPHGLAGGSGTALLPMAAIASGKYGFVLVTGAAAAA